MHAIARARPLSPCLRRTAHWHADAIPRVAWCGGGSRRWRGRSRRNALGITYCGCLDRRDGPIVCIRDEGMRTAAAPSRLHVGSRGRGGVRRIRPPRTGRYLSAVRVSGQPSVPVRSSMHSSGVCLRLRGDHSAGATEVERAPDALRCGDHERRLLLVVAVRIAKHARQHHALLKRHVRDVPGDQHWRKYQHAT